VASTSRETVGSRDVAIPPLCALVAPLAVGLHASNGPHPIRPHRPVVSADLSGFRDRVGGTQRRRRARRVRPFGVRRERGGQVRRHSLTHIEPESEPSKRATMLIEASGSRGSPTSASARPRPTDTSGIAGVCTSPIRTCRSGAGEELSRDFVVTTAARVFSSPTRWRTTRRTLRRSSQTGVAG